MTFRATLHEVANLLRVTELGKLEKSGCRGVAVCLNHLQPGQLFFDFHGEAQHAFDNGASIIISQRHVELSEEASRYCIYTEDVRRTFWELFRWWKESMSSPVAVVLGGGGELAWFEQIVASALLSLQKGCFRTGSDLTQSDEDLEKEYALATEVMNSEEGSLWYLIGLELNMNTLLSELSPNLLIAPNKEIVALAAISESEAAVITLDSYSSDVKSENPVGSGGSTSDRERLVYLDRGRSAYISDDFSISEWPVPNLQLVRALRALPAISEACGMDFSQGAFEEIGSRFFPPSSLGFHIGLGEVGDLWIERRCSPCAKTLELLVADGDGITFGVIVDSLPALQALLAITDSQLGGDIRLFFLGESMPEGVLVQTEMHAARISHISEVISQLAESPSIFLIAYLTNNKLAEELFQKRDELYTLANQSPNGDETS